MVNLLIVLLAIFILGSIILGFYLSYRCGHYVGQLEQRLTNLENASHFKRLPNKTLEGIEDAQAVLIEVAQEVQITDLRLKQLHDILRILRNTPLTYEYGPDGQKSEKKSVEGESKS